MVTGGEKKSRQLLPGLGSNPHTHEDLQHLIKESRSEVSPSLPGRVCVRVCPSSHLQNEVPRKQPVGAPGRTVLVQALYVDAPQVPSAERHSHLHPRPPYRHQSRLGHLPVALRRHSRGHTSGQVGASGSSSGASRYVCARALPDEVAGAGGGRGLLGGGGERTLVLFTERIDGGVIVGGGSSAPLGRRLSADRLQAGAAKKKKKVKNRNDLVPLIK